MSSDSISTSCDTVFAELAVVQVQHVSSLYPSPPWLLPAPHHPLRPRATVCKFLFLQQGSLRRYAWKGFINFFPKFLQTPLYLFEEKKVWIINFHCKEEWLKFSCIEWVEKTPPSKKEKKKKASLAGHGWAGRLPGRSLGWCHARDK